MSQGSSRRTQERHRPEKWKSRKVVPEHIHCFIAELLLSLLAIEYFAEASAATATPNTSRPARQVPATTKGVRAAASPEQRRESAATIWSVFGVQFRIRDPSPPTSGSDDKFRTQSPEILDPKCQQLSRCLLRGVVASSAAATETTAGGECDPMTVLLRYKLRPVTNRSQLWK